MAKSDKYLGKVIMDADGELGIIYDYDYDGYHGSFCAELKDDRILRFNWTGCFVIENHFDVIGDL